jgi:hypothetical protein
MKHIRAATLYRNGKKLGSANKGKLSTKNNGSLEYGDGGEVVAFVIGAIQNDLSFDTVVFFEGNTETQAFAEELESGTSSKIQIGIVDGKIEQGDYWMTGRDIEWDHKAGTMSGSFQLIGGANSRT